jgi:thioredoxin 1
MNQSYTIILIFFCFFIFLNWIFFSQKWGDKIIRFQNKAEAHFLENKSFGNFFPYLFAFILFITSTLLAQIRMPYTFLKKALQKKEEDKALIELESKEQLETIFLKEEKVLIDFWAEWCGPCIMMEPAIKEFATAHSNKVQVVKINATKHSKLLKELKVKGLPQILLFQNGMEAKRHAGAMTKKEMEDFAFGK